MTRGLRLMIALAMAAPPIAGAIALTTAAGPALAEMDKEGGKGKDRFPHIERMAKKLDLTSAQVDQLKKYAGAHREAMAPLMKQAKEQMRSLRDLVEKKASDAELTAALAKLKSTRKTIQAENDKHMDQTGAVLTPMQQAKTALWMGKQAGKKMRHMRERRGHRGGDRDDRHGDEEEDDD